MHCVHQCYKLFWWSQQCCFGFFFPFFSFLFFLSLSLTKPKAAFQGWNSTPESCVHCQGEHFFGLNSITLSSLFCQASRTHLLCENLSPGLNQQVQVFDWERRTRTCWTTAEKEKVDLNQALFIPLRGPLAAARRRNGPFAPHCGGVAGSLGDQMCVLICLCEQNKQPRVFQRPLRKHSWLSWHPSPPPPGFLEDWFESIQLSYAAVFPFVWFFFATHPQSVYSFLRPFSLVSKEASVSG